MIIRAGLGLASICREEKPEPAKRPGTSARSERNPPGKLTGLRPGGIQGVTSVDHPLLPVGVTIQRGVVTGHGERCPERSWSLCTTRTSKPICIGVVLFEAEAASYGEKSDFSCRSAVGSWQSLVPRKGGS